MQRIALFCIGALKSSWFQDAATEYQKRLSHDLQFEVTILPDGRQSDPEQRKEDESGRLLQAIEKRWGAVWLLDERGAEYTSQKFADAISSLRDESRPVLFVIGGAYGVSDTLRSSADHVMRLSAMTLPHELCRIVFLEQLYRAVQIQKGTGYHH